MQGDHAAEAGGGCGLEEERSHVRLGAASQAERELLRNREGETVRPGSSGLAREAGRRPSARLVGGRGEDEEAGKQGGQMAPGLVSLGEDMVAYPRTSGKPWQSFKQGRSDLPLPLRHSGSSLQSPVDRLPR